MPTAGMISWRPYLSYSPSDRGHFQSAGCSASRSRASASASSALSCCSCASAAVTLALSSSTLPILGTFKGSMGQIREDVKV
jgi:hypothetical protein